VKRFFVTCSLLFAVGSNSHAFGQEKVGVPAERRGVTIRLPSGGQVDVLCKEGQATNQDVIAALDEAARQLRGEGGPDIVLPDPPPVAEDGMLPSPNGVAGPIPHPLPEQADCAQRCSKKCEFLPTTLLWTPPLANQWQPRSFVKATTLENSNTSGNVDTAIGATYGLFRMTTTERPHEGMQLDLFAVVFSRWAELRDAVGVDYRFGLPLSFAYGPWSARISYEHTSTHVGDELAERTGRKHQSSRRDEIVLGLAYTFWDHVRVYGQAGYAGLGFAVPSGSSKRDRYNWGLEWIGQETSWWLKGQPFAAFDMDLRGDQNYTANTTAQVGWRWTAAQDRPAIRLALEYYDGRSPYGQFHLDRESWFGVGAIIDY
jgi:hypothetical protein